MICRIIFSNKIHKPFIATIALIIVIADSALVINTFHITDFALVYGAIAVG